MHRQLHEPTDITGGKPTSSSRLAQRTSCRFSNSVSYSHLPCHVDGIYDTNLRHREGVRCRRDTQLRCRCSGLSAKRVDRGARSTANDCSMMLEPLMPRMVDVTGRY